MDKTPVAEVGREPKRSTGRKCVVTGSASGIGLALVSSLLDDGWDVTGIDRAPHPRDIAGKITVIEADLTDPAAIDMIALPDAPGSVTAFVHCAGIMRGDDDPEIRRTGGGLLWQLHVAAAEALVHRLAPAMADGAGRIVLMSSRAAQGRAGRAYYAASKSAIDGLTRSLAATLVWRGITVNAVAPGTTDTPMLKAPGREGLPIMPLPIGRAVRPDEIAGLIGFLIGDLAGAITGQTIFVCGGSSIAGIADR